MGFVALPTPTRMKIREFGEIKRKDAIFPANFPFLRRSGGICGFTDPDAYEDTRVWGGKTQRPPLIPQKTLKFVVPVIIFFKVSLHNLTNSVDNTVGVDTEVRHNILVKTDGCKGVLNT